MIGTVRKLHKVSENPALILGFSTPGVVSKEPHPKAIDWKVAAKRSQVKKLEESRELRRVVEQIETLKARVHSPVEHAFHILRNLFGHRKTRYKGLAKNRSQLYSLFALDHPVMVERLRAECTQGASLI